MNIKPASIVGIPFPYTDLSTRKRRPVLVLTNPDQRGDFIGLPVTSVQTEHLAVCIDKESIENGNLPITSWVRYDKIFTLSQDWIPANCETLSTSTSHHGSTGFCVRCRKLSAERYKWQTTSRKERLNLYL